MGEEVKMEDISDGTENKRMPLEEKQKEDEGSEARRRWRGACKLALHTNPGALHTNPGALHTNHGSGTKKLSLPELHTDSGKQKLDGPARRTSTGSCKLVMHTDKANNGDASSKLDAIRADTNSRAPRACNFGMHTTLAEVDTNSNSDPGNFFKITPTTKNEATMRKTSDPGPHSKVTQQSTDIKTTVRKTSDPGPHSKTTTLTSTENSTMRKKWKSACKLVLHTNSLTTKKEKKKEEEVFGMHTRPARLAAPKIKVEEAEDEEAENTLEEEEEAGESVSRGGGKGTRCRLTLHCGDDDQEVTPGALLSISMKKQGQASKSRRLSDCLLHQVLITNLVHQAEEEVQRSIRESFCFPF